MRASLLFLSLFFLAAPALGVPRIAAPGCLTIGLLGEFRNSTGSFTQSFGGEIRRGVELGLELLKARDPSACVRFETLDIDNSIANIDGIVRLGAAQGIRYFIGLGTSDQALAAREALAQTKSVLITPTASSTELLAAPSRTVLLFPTNDQIAGATARELWKRGVRSVTTIFASNSRYSKDLTAAFRSAFTALGGSIREIPVRAGRVDLGTELASLKAVPPSHVLVALFELDAARAISQILSAGLDPMFVGTDAWGTSSAVIQNLLGKGRMRAIAPDIYSTERKSGKNAWFVGEYRRKFKKDPTDLSAFSFDAVGLAVRLKQECGAEPATDSLAPCLGRALPIVSTTGTLRAGSGLAVQRTVRMRDVRFGKGIVR